MNEKNEMLLQRTAPSFPKTGYDPEMLFVECSRCGNPIVWERGRTTEILDGAGIDALELDSHCLLVTDGCPQCSSSGAYHIQIFRVAPNSGFDAGMGMGFGVTGKGHYVGHA